MYKFYSVRCYGDWGRPKGGDFQTRVAADSYFNCAVKSDRVVSVHLFG